MIGVWFICGFGQCGYQIQAGYYIVGLGWFKQEASKLAMLAAQLFATA